MRVPVLGAQVGQLAFVDGGRFIGFGGAAREAVRVVLGGAAVRRARRVRQLVLLAQLRVVMLVGRTDRVFGVRVTVVTVMRSRLKVSEDLTHQHAVYLNP